jgi:hypothetical protein
MIGLPAFRGRSFTVAARIVTQHWEAALAGLFAILAENGVKVSGRAAKSRASMNCFRGMHNRVESRSHHDPSVPAWFGPSGISSHMTVYFCVASFPKTKRVLIDPGLKTAANARDIPHSLTLEEAAAADHADLSQVLEALRTFFSKRQPRRRPGRGKTFSMSRLRRAELLRFS